MGLLLLAGCITTAKTGEAFHKIQQPATGMAALYIYAPPTGMPILGHMSTKIFINDAAVAHIDETYFTRFELLPGTYHIHASTDSQGACGGQFFPGRRYPPVTIAAVADQVYFIRYSSHPTVYRASSCDRYLRMIELETARRELEGLDAARSNSSLTT
jgi:hypothetical protein